MIDARLRKDGIMADKDKNREEADKEEAGKPENVNEALSEATKPLHITEDEPAQGEQFTEPKIGGLYPMAGIVIGGVVVICVAIWFAI